jgi:hypothetical protein
MSEKLEEEDDQSNRTHSDKQEPFFAQKVHKRLQHGFHKTFTLV